MEGVRDDGNQVDFESRTTRPIPLPSPVVPLHKSCKETEELPLSQDAGQLEPVAGAAPPEKMRRKRSQKTKSLLP